MDRSAWTNIITGHRYPLALWVGITFALALSASAVYWDSSRVEVGQGSRWLTVEQLNAEYRASTANLVLPDNTQWPSQLPYGAADEDGMPYTYGAGIGAEWAEWYWFDAWALASVSSSETTSTRQLAVAQLPGFYHTTAYLTAEDQQYYRDMIAAAQSGDCVSLREYVATIQNGTE